jgi:tetratricopeptide (TPR) repeat protein
LAFSLRAEFRNRLKETKNAVADAETAYKVSSHSVATALLLANLYINAGRFDEALAVLNAMPESAQRSTPALSLRESIVANTSQGPDARKSLEALVEKDPKNASLLARLGGMYRVDNPQRSLDYFRRAVEAEPRNPNYATGYGAALVQAKRFADAAALLSQVVAVDPGNYAAHANLATALYELKSYAGAVSEYNWLLGVKQDLFVADFFIAISYDKLGQYEDALKYYEEFLAKANPAENELEIEKVKLRLPALRNQIKRGAGVKPQKQK